MVAGTPESWDPSVAISSSHHSRISSATWSQCGQFVATQAKRAVEIRDALTSGLFSALQPTEPISKLIGAPTYSPDGRSIACASNAMIIIWDIQTGGVVKEIRRNEAGDASLVWLLDGRVIGIISWYRWTMRVYDVASDTVRTVLSGIKLESRDRPHLWAHGEYFRVAVTGIEDGALAIGIFEAWSTITKIESFRIKSLGPDYRISSFSPTTYRISVWSPNQWILVLDIQSSGRLLTTGWPTQSSCFSPDGTFFAASSQTDDRIHIWKCTAGHYTPWRKFQTQDRLNDGLQFSPTSSSILVCSGKVLRVWRLNIPSTSLSTHGLQHIAFSCLGAYAAAAKDKSSTVIVTNLLSLAPFQLIDTGLEIRRLVLTGNVLLAMGTTSTKAWLLTEEGIVDGVPRGRRAGPGDSIWTMQRGWDMPRTAFPEFAHEGEIRVIGDISGSNATHIYHTRTGEILDSPPPPSHNAQNWQGSTRDSGWLHLRRRDLDKRSGHAEDNWLVSKSTVERGWVTDPAGNHRLWVPVEWRAFESAEWYYDITTLHLKLGPPRSIIIKF